MSLLFLQRAAVFSAIFITFDKSFFVRAFSVYVVLGGLTVFAELDIFCPKVGVTLHVTKYRRDSPSPCHTEHAAIRR